MIKDKAKVILIYPKTGGAFEKMRNMRPMPLGLLSASAFLVNKYDVVIFDQNLHRNWKNALKDELTPDTVAVGIHAMAGPPLLTALETSRYVKSIRPVPVIWGGVFPSMVPDDVLKEDCIDYVCVREGERTLPELIDSIVSGIKPEKVAGLCFKDNGKITFTGDRPFIDLNEVPNLPYELLSIPSYNVSQGFRYRKKTIETAN